MPFIRWWKMMKNKVKEMLEQGQASVGTWVTTASPDVAEILADVGFDWLIFDMEHAPLGIGTVQNLIQATNGSDIVPIVRVAWNDQVLIKLALDIGSYGLLIPLVNSREDAVDAVRATKYPPLGIRGVGPRRASNYYRSFQDYFAEANEEIMVIVQIEHLKAVENIDTISSVDGLDAIYIGPADLTASMGLFGQYSDPKVVEAIDKVLLSCQKAGVPVGTHAFDVESVSQLITKGFQFITIGTDIGFLIQGCTQTLSQINKHKGRKAMM